MLGMGNVCLELDLVSEWTPNEKLPEDLVARRRNQRTRGMCPTYQNLRNTASPQEPTEAIYWMRYSTSDFFWPRMRRKS